MFGSKIILFSIFISFFGFSNQTHAVSAEFKKHAERVKSVIINFFDFKLLTLLVVAFLGSVATASTCPEGVSLCENGGPYIEYVAPVHEITSHYPLAGLYRVYGDIPSYEFSDDNPIFSSAKKFLKRAKAATIDYDSHCSGTFISDTGHVLTAKHCLVGLNTVNHGVDFGDRSKPIQLANKSYAQFGKPLDDTTYRNVQLVAWGEGDWAIVKFSDLPETHSCVPHSMKLPSSGDRIWSSGFPIDEKPDPKLVTTENLRRDFGVQRLRDMANPQTSHQELRDAMIETDEIMWKMMEEMDTTDQFLIMERFRYANTHVVSLGRFYPTYEEAYSKLRYPFYGPNGGIDSYKFPQYAFSTLHAASGFSGGGIYNEKAELIGTKAAKSGGPVFGEIYNIGAWFATIHSIKSSIRDLHQYSQSQVDEMFNCDLRSAH